MIVCVIGDSKWYFKFIVMGNVFGKWSMVNIVVILVFNCVVVVRIFVGFIELFIMMFCYGIKYLWIYGLFLILLVVNEVNSGSKGEFCICFVFVLI